MQTPFGPLASPNITPDVETGIGSWSDEDFYRLMHEGIRKDGAYVYPVMPFPWYTIVRRDDVLAIKAYLFSLAPVHRPRPPNTLSFPFNVRESLLAWREAFFKPGDFKPDPNQSSEVNRGAYLVNGLAHCGECHNARAVAGTSRWREPLAGGTVENWYAPNITSDVRDGIGAWTNQELVRFLKTGAVPGKGIAAGPMAETVHSLSQLGDADLNAIAAYLKTTAPKQETKTLTDPPGLYQRGAQTYLSNCASCHGVHGEGMPRVIPALQGNIAVVAAEPQNVISVVLGGLPAKGNYAPMSAIGAGMSDAEVADVVNYVRQTWGNNAPANATPAMVANLRREADTLLNAAPLTGCPKIGNASLAKVLGRDDIARQLAAMSDADMYQHSRQWVATLRAAAPGVHDADLINGLAAAYCPVVRADVRLDWDAKALKIGQFVQYVYMAVAAPQH